MRTANTSELLPFYHVYHIAFNCCSDLSSLVQPLCVRVTNITKQTMRFDAVSLDHRNDWLRDHSQLQLVDIIITTWMCVLCVLFVLPYLISYAKCDKWFMLQTFTISARWRRDIYFFLCEINVTDNLLHEIDDFRWCIHFFFVGVVSRTVSCRRTFQFSCARMFALRMKAIVIVNLQTKQIDYKTRNLFLFDSVPTQKTELLSFWQQLRCSFFH